MKITSFNPLIVTNNAEPTVKLFEAMGFEVRHKPSSEDFAFYRMTDASDFHVDVVQVAAKVERDMTVIRVNVDDYDGAQKFLLDKGFTSLGQNDVFASMHANSIMMMAPSGYLVCVFQHIK